ncbi:MAG: enoyl-CoA hydratase/isomerase family protein [Flavobacteriaceae bacterium]|nr:enoyl-CoA hydratase/isomerase family protein [Flavobacteriaceae bacterium]
MTHIEYHIDTDGIAFVTWNVADIPVNIMNKTTMDEFFQTMKLAISDKNVVGIVINSAKNDFIAGGDLKWFLNYNNSKEDCFDMFMETHKNMRAIETCGKPVVAAINGLAFGGGCEIALNCHHRIMTDHPKNRIGLVECSIGLFPGAGGTQRYLRLIGIQKTIQYITQSKKLSAKQALKDGLVDALCSPEDDINALAKKWILNQGNTVQPWDVKGFKIPGTPMGVGQISGSTEFFSVSNAMAYKTTHGNKPHIKNALSVIYYGAGCGIEKGLEVEARHFVHTLFSKETKNIIRTGFVFMGEASKGKSKPKGFETQKINTLGIIGAGMMGSGIAYVSAKAGIRVILNDVSHKSSLKGIHYIKKQEDKKLAKGRTTADKITKLLALISPSNSLSDLSECDLVIEAVYENETLKNTITKNTEAVISEAVIYASNTSTIPITQLAKASKKPSQFIGLHFFSPVEKMKLVEVIVGEQTSDKTLAIAMDFVTQIRKIPIVVNDGRGFFTSRVFGKFVNEGIGMLSEGIPPALIENVAKKIGMPVGPLAISDEVNLKLMLLIMNENPNLDAYEKGLKATINTLVNTHQRTGKKEGKGFYDYPLNETKHLWKEWATIFPVNNTFNEEEIGKRLLFSMVIDAYKCLESGVLKEAKDADIGSVLGLGFPIHTGGVLSYIDYIGGEEFEKYSLFLSQKHGKRFELPHSLKKRISTAAGGRVFYAS